MDISLHERLQFHVQSSVMEQIWPQPHTHNASGGSLVVTEYKDVSFQSQLTTILIFILVTAASKLYLQKGKKKYNLPGPKPLPLIGNAHLLAGDTSKLMYKVLDLLDEYNGIMALWIGHKPQIFVSEPEHLETFCTHPKLQDKSELYHYIKPLLGESIFTSNGATWKQGRKLMLPSLRPAFLKNMMPSFNDHTRTMITLIGKEDGEKSFDVFPYLRDAAYAMIFESVMGRKVNIEDSLETLKEAEELMDLVYQRGLKLWLQWDPLYFLLPVGKRFQAGVNKVNGFNTNHILTSLQLLQDGKISKGSEGQILVEHLLNKIGTDESQIQIIREHAQTMLITGYDTTAGTMGFLLMMLGIHQDVQQKLYEEVMSVNTLVEDDLSVDDLLKLEYLERVIKETLRLFPVGPLIFREASDDVKIGNVIVPRGASVTCVMLRTHRNPKIYPEPLKFNPDNFLPERIAKRHPYSYLPFSSGSRGCIGVKYGMMSMKVIISHLIVNYQIFCDTKMDEIRLKPEITMKIEGGFKIRIKKRSNLS